LSKLQCIVTSYKRLRYLKPCLESMKLDDIELYVVDGGGDEQIALFLTWAKISGLIADFHITSVENPGADRLKNIGIEKYVTGPEFVMSSDDFLFHRDWSVKLMRQYRALNAAGLRFPMVALPTELVIERHIVKDQRGKWATINGVQFMDTSCAMVSGTIMDTAVTRRVELFPVFGRGGHGDVAIGGRMRKCGYQVGYLAEPIIWHLGHEPDKEVHFPEYAAAYDKDTVDWRDVAKRDDWRP
jgi:hypothetical protein